MGSRRGWPAATFFLTGGRVKVELRIGAMHHAGTGMVTSPVGSARPEDAVKLAQQGYTRPIVAVRVRNIGRLPVIVTGWSIGASSAPTRGSNLLRSAIQ